MRRRDLPKIGFWYSDREPEFPHPEPDFEWNETARRAVIEYLKAGGVTERYRGYSYCRVCDKTNGSQEQSDGTYVWPSGLAHYIEEHNVRLPDEFVEHVMNQAG